MGTRAHPRKATRVPTGHPRPRRTCPICGTIQLVSCLRSHVGGDRCKLTLQALGGVHATPEGPAVLSLADQLEHLLRTYAEPPVSLAGEQPPDPTHKP